MARKPDAWAMAAISAALFAAVVPGKRVILPSDGYYTVRLFAEVFLRPFGVTLDYVPTVDMAAADFTGAGIVYIETPSNPGLEVCDIAAVAARAHAAGTCRCRVELRGREDGGWLVLKNGVCPLLFKQASACCSQGKDKHAPSHKHTKGYSAAPCSAQCWWQPPPAHCSSPQGPSKPYPAQSATPPPPPTTHCTCTPPAAAQCPDC